jgi:hypothetical protein
MAIPRIDNKFICIVDYKRPELAAIISSYLYKEDFYLPIFEFPSVSSKVYEPETDLVDENTLSRIRANEFATFCNNIAAQIGADDNIVIAGLSREQKSYLDFIDKFNVINIDDANEIDFHLSPFLAFPKEVLNCKKENLLLGLFISQRENRILRINESAEDVFTDLVNDRGIVIIEDDKYVSSVIAVNYASSINSNICIVKAASQDDKQAIKDNIEEWKKGDTDKYKEIENVINERIGGIEFTRFTFATFFTNGLPYSLILKNCIACTYVGLHLRPDFFIVNNLIFERRNQFGGAVVFSPQFFKDEETKLISSILNKSNYFVKDLFGKEANVYNLDMHLKQFPYDIFHICSHGGEIEGHSVEEDFIDRDGNKHTVLYDQVLSFSPSSRKGLITVQRKTYFKKLNGLVWKSKELKSKNYPHYVFADMQNAMHVSKASQKKIIGDNKRISNSCMIQCSDSTYQGMFNTLASHSSPFIFNNTCSSWFQIAEPFLSSGARGYIGTLWDVENKAAIDFATELYAVVFSDTILNSFQNALRSLNGSSSANIYIFWGLHFSTLMSFTNKEDSRAVVFKHLLRSFYRWKDRLSIIKNKTTQQLIADLIKWVISELATAFNRNDFDLLKQKSHEKN